ncbi:LysM peptidoglycan-binding domain-containing protein [Rubricoccus marinus]|uniref:LysM domain-containing protein n=1 Tax=Rubricoccus marinus TaxID=716817 RepID=A0A259U254_9BACT|nr:LysM peptidoglycan-binding domain-containing protein [Rubricoccus marinus]OZC04079.1 hypothetical protein BSZ36_14450 [Rubricoccus marinus]
MLRTLTLLLLVASGAPAVAQSLPARSLQAGMADLRLATAVRLALVADLRTRTLDVEVAARDGVVTVTGINDEAYQSVAAQVARANPRVRGLQGLGAAGLNAAPPEARSAGATAEGAAGDVAAPAPVQISEQPRTHTVRRGDTLYGIAREYNTTLDELVRINGLRSTDIRIGQRVRVR